MPSLKPLVAGNWKMNGLKASAAELGKIMSGYGTDLKGKVELAICPPATLLSTFAVVALGSKLAIGAQDCHAKASGAHTGDLSAEMIADTGATHVIVGHSERRTDHAETDAQVRAKAEAAWRAGLVAILCIGETESERRGGTTLDVIDHQLAGSVPEGSTAANLVIAYEPVWAIGTGLTPSNDDIAEVHAHIRKRLAARFGAEGEGVRILYGGSVKPSNAAEILKIGDVNGALVGGASLKADDFLAIAAAYA
ncbi:triose-phosphate isomerase [Kaistia dalseonensis]|uniref:Triosephosphate isomerase n=1 Tax=Kaistia dalseonensis TaxID=410840 RepID=A0ABU0H392_9HYPH|nr:triose-phosphate isomerase [Kaistia dalseonensis]MCX5494176.1 triose-phosphate isomerase [Kaistia dalseonensis]MDQ0436755.1 triosephosphate isomerase [Kaistia dalseonensis]